MHLYNNLTKSTYYSTKESLMYQTKDKSAERKTKMIGELRGYISEYVSAGTNRVVNKQKKECLFIKCKSRVKFDSDRVYCRHHDTEDKRDRSKLGSYERIVDLKQDKVVLDVKNFIIKKENKVLESKIECLEEDAIFSNVRIDILEGDVLVLEEKVDDLNEQVELIGNELSVSRIVNSIQSRVITNLHNSEKISLIKINNLTSSLHSLHSLYKKNKTLYRDINVKRKTDKKRKNKNKPLKTTKNKPKNFNRVFHLVI